jgi:hypothetical protein
MDFYEQVAETDGLLSVTAHYGGCRNYGWRRNGHREF